MSIEAPQRLPLNPDFSTLSWVKDEICKSLAQTQHNLEAYAANHADKSPLRLSITYLHQVLGTLQMVEIFGAALLAEEMEKTATALYKGETLKVDEALDSLMRTTIQLPAYLENLEQGHPDIPAVLTPLLNDLRSARGDTLLSDNAFFNPDLHVVPPHIPLPGGKQHADIQGYARKLRPVFQAALLSWLRDKQGEASLKKLAAVLRQLQAVSANDDARRVWWVMGAVIEALQHKGIAAGSSINMLLGQIDNEIKRLIHHGESIFSQKPPIQLLKNTLYQLGRADSQGPLLTEIKSAFRLTELIPLHATIEQAIDALKGSNAEILHNVSAIIKNDLQDSLELLNNYQRNPAEDVSQLSPVVDVLKRSGDTLILLGRPDLRSLVAGQAEQLQRFVSNHQGIDENKLLEIASDLAYVDSALNHLEQPPEQAAASDITHAAEEDASRTVFLPHAELTDINLQVYKQSLELLAYIKAALSSFELEPSASEAIQDIPGKLLQLKSTLAFMGFERPAQLLGPISTFIERHMLAAAASPTPEQLDTLADAITSIEFYFEALVDGRKRPEAILTVAEISVEQLGYAVDEHAVISTLLPESDWAEDHDAQAFSVSDKLSSQAQDTAAGIDQEIRDVFADEANELIADNQNFIRTLQQDHSQREALDELRRNCHTLKGSARLAGAAALGDVAGCTENLLNTITKLTILPGPAVLELLSQTTPLLNSLLSAFMEESINPPPIKAYCDQAKYLATAAQGANLQPLLVPHPEQGTAAATPPGATEPSLLNVFAEEAHSHLQIIQQYLQEHAMQDGAAITAALSSAMNTLDGSARMAKITPIAELSHAMGQLLHAYRNQDMALDSEALLTLANFADTVSTLVQNLGIPEAQGLDYSHLLEDIALLQSKADQQQADNSTTASLSSEQQDGAGIVMPLPSQASEPENSVYDPEMLAIFVEEAEEIQEKTEAIIQDWAQDYYRLEPVSRLQRILHTLKGSARMANVTAIGDLAHAMESLLEGIIVKRFAPQAEHPHLLQRCHDWLSRALEKAQQFYVVEPASALLDSIDLAIEQALAAKHAPAATTSPAEHSIPGVADEHSNDLNEIIEFIETFTFDAQQESKRATQAPAQLDEQIRVRAEVLNELISHAGEINIFNARIGQQLKEWQFNLSELQQTVERLRDQLRQFEIEAETQIIFRHEPQQPQREDFDPLELDRFSNMQQLSRGMVESLSDLTSLETALQTISRNAGGLLYQQQQLTSEMQEHLMRTRMVPFSSILPRLRRVVRQTCNETGKFAELIVTGTEAELDRSQLSRIVTIIEHLLRNAIDHGIETPDKRDQLGKQRVGQLHLDYKHQGSEIVLKISDDGTGININTLRDKAIARGLMTADEQLADQDIINFIYESGFSTAQTLTQISGRGVGLDIVNNEVKQLGGVLNIESSSGQGASFTLHFPLTMLINQALLVRACDTIYAVPLTNVEHVVRVTREELEGLFLRKQRGFVYADRDYQYFNLGQMLYESASPLPDAEQRLPLLLLRSGEQRIALHVDELLDRQEIVIKAIGPQLSTLGILSGASILPDGQVALILDIANLIRSASSQKSTSDIAVTTVDNNITSNRPLKVMVVDDSITVRKVTARLLNRYHYETLTAKDGLEALDIMEENIPDIILVDVEMPRMDGFELSAVIRANRQLQAIPIIMITSRSGDKHRQRALDIGVNKYMGKPFQEKELIDNIQQLTAQHAH